jgi:Flp pilus assembly pilin Flp
MRMQALRRFLADEHGAAAIELAMVAPIIAGVVAASFGI